MSAGRNMAVGQILYEHIVFEQYRIRLLTLVLPKKRFSR